MKLIASLFALVVVLGFALGISLLMAYPTMWLVNFIFAPSLLTFVFGAPKITFWTAWALNALVTGLQVSSSKK